MDGTDWLSIAVLGGLKIVFRLADTGERIPVGTSNVIAFQSSLAASFLASKHSTGGFLICISHLLHSSCWQACSC